MKEHPTIEKNLLRVDRLVDDSVQITPEGYPLFRWLEISPIDVCNRKCSFCPKSDKSLAPDQPTAVMPPDLFEKIALELYDADYSGTVMLAGYGEPLLSRHILSMIKTFSKVCNTEITTNGDPLNEKRITQLLEAGVHKIIVSLYDGPEQIDQMTKMFRNAGVDEDHYILRDRWYPEEEGFGLKLTNRGGTINLGEDAPHKKSPCFYPDYMMMVDWNGDVFLCTQDWNRRVRSGNLNFQQIQEVWNSSVLKRYRKNLHCGLRSEAPCLNCNADGTKHGRGHADAWNQFYNKKRPMVFV